MPTPKYYLIDENKNLIEGFDKEAFLGILEQAIENGTLEDIDEDSAVASKIRSVLNGTTHHIEFVTQAQYNQLVEDEELTPNTWYFITDDDTGETIDELDDDIEDHETRITALEQKNSVVDLGSYQEFEDVLSALYQNFSSSINYYTATVGNEKVKLQVLGQGHYDEEGTHQTHVTYFVSFIYYTDVLMETTNAYKKGWAVGDNQGGQSYARWTIFYFGDTSYTLNDDFQRINLTQTLPNFNPTKAYHFVLSAESGTSDGRGRFNFGVCQSPNSGQGINVGTGFNAIDNRAYSLILSSAGVPSLYRKLRGETNFSQVTDSTTLSGMYLYYKEIR